MRNALAICGAVMPSAPRANAKSSFVCFILAPIVWGTSRSPVWRLTAIWYGHVALRVNSIFWLDGKILGRIVLSLRIDGDGARLYRIVIKEKHDKPI
jgi:hypothetical protein